MSIKTRIHAIQLFSTNYTKNMQKYNKHLEGKNTINTTLFSDLFIFWFTNKGTQYFCLSYKSSQI